MLALHAILCNHACLEGNGMSQTATQSDSDMVRDYVRQTFLAPAQKAGERTVSVNVGSVHKALKLQNRVPLVCAALKSRKFLEEHGLRILTTTGPPSGQSTTVTFTYELVRADSRSPAAANPLIGLRGVAKDLFKKLGGGEHFISSERKKFAGDRVD
jgi:hypothetical protein